MIQQFIYGPQHVGLSEWPSGTLRLTGMPVTNTPTDAGIFVVPGSLALFRDPKSLAKLPYFNGREHIHVFFDVSDYETKYNQPSLFIRCNLRPWNFPADPNSIQLAWPVEDFAECQELPDGRFKYDVTFQGWNWSETRQISTAACLRNNALNCDIALHKEFFGYIEGTEEGNRRRAEYIRSLKECRVALCPESINGVFPYRFFEAMSAARVPVLVGSDFVWPFQEEVPYESFTVMVPRDKAHQVDRYIFDFVRSHSDDAIIEMGRRARGYWEKWLDSRKWPELMAYAVTKQLAKRATAAVK